MFRLPSPIQYSRKFLYENGWSSFWKINVTGRLFSVHHFQKFKEWQKSAAVLKYQVSSLKNYFIFKLDNGTKYVAVTQYISGSQASNSPPSPQKKIFFKNLNPPLWVKARICKFLEVLAWNRLSVFRTSRPGIPFRAAGNLQIRTILGNFSTYPLN